MGWTESEIQNELLSRCKHRIQFMKEAVSSRNALAAAHSSYAYGLQKIGAALTDNISEALSHHSSSVATPATPRIFIPRRLIPSPSSPATLQTAVGLPEIHQQVVELSRFTVLEMEQQMKPIKKLGKTGKLMSLIPIFHILHNHFLMASEGAHEVYQILSNFADSRGWQLCGKTMRYNHESQAGIVQALKLLDSFQVRPLEETRRYHLPRIILLLAVVREWYTLFCRLIDYQKDYIRARHSWLNLNLTPFESNSLIHELAKAWNDAMDKLPDEIARNAIRKFAAVILTIVQRENEMKMREKCDATRLELDCKSTQYEDWCAKNGVNGKLDSENPR